MNIELKQTIGHDVMQKEGAKMLADTLCQANGKDVSQMLCGGLELMLNSAVNGFLKNWSNNIFHIFLSYQNINFRLVSIIVLKRQVA